MQNITIRIYPNLDGVGEEWTTVGYVYGEWAVHRQHEGDSPYLRATPWHVTHLPSSAMAFVAKRRSAALLAAERLENIMPLRVEITQDDPCSRPQVKPLPPDWIQLAAQAVDGIDIWTPQGGQLIRPADLAKHIAAERVELTTEEGG